MEPFTRRSTDQPDYVPPMTEGQLVYFTQQTERAAHRASSRTRRQTLAAWVSLLVGIGLAFYVNNHDISTTSEAANKAIVKSGRAVAVEGCNRDFKDRVRFRALLTRLKDSSDASYKAGSTTAAQHDAAVAFYNDQLRAFTLPDCRRTEHLLSLDPPRPIPTFKPLHPGNVHG